MAVWTISARSRCSLSASSQRRERKSALSRLSIARRFLIGGLSSRGIVDLDRVGHSSLSSLIRRQPVPCLLHLLVVLHAPRRLRYLSLIRRAIARVVVR